MSNINDTKLTINKGDVNPFEDCIDALKNCMDELSTEMPDKIDKVHSELNKQIKSVEYQVKAIRKENKLHRHKEQIKEFLSQHSLGWTVRMLTYTSTYYSGIVLTYIKEDKFYHIVFDVNMDNDYDYYYEVIRYKKNRYLIAVRRTTSKETIFYIDFNSNNQTATSILDPVQELIDSQNILSSLGYKLPKSYVKKLLYRRSRDKGVVVDDGIIYREDRIKSLEKNPD